MSSFIIILTVYKDSQIVYSGGWKTRFCIVLQELKLVADLELRGKGGLETRTVTVCSGLDLVNINYNNFVAPDESTAEVRRMEMFLAFRVVEHFTFVI